MDYYGDIYVTVKQRLRVSLTTESDKKPNKKEILKALNHIECDVSYNDINDEESLKYISVDKVNIDKDEDSLDIE